MKTLHYQLTLLSDAEPGSGLGGEIVNSIVARDHKGNPVLRGTHLKGLMRAEIEKMTLDRNWPSDLLTAVFGRAGEHKDHGIESAIRVPDAKAQGASDVRNITRTRLTDLGVVREGSLRTSEAVAAGTKFMGEAQIRDDAPPFVETALLLALTSLSAIGGGRTRGGGACRVEVQGTNESPGSLLKKLDELMHAQDGLTPVSWDVPEVSVSAGSGSHAMLALTYRALEPVCCPETPVLGNNTIRSGIDIPASAVLGALIARLASADKELAQRAFIDPGTRAWPLLPCGEDSPDGSLPIPVRVALSHRMSKLKGDDGNHFFRDAAIDPYDWQSVARGSPLKGADGVLLRDGGEDSVRLWRSHDMPRILTSHAVHFDPEGKGRRNLFSVEAMAPLVYRGWIRLPEDAANALEKLLGENPKMAFGKSRTVRGGGKLSVERADLAATVNEWEDGRVFVLQSPAAIPDDWSMESARAERQLERLVRESGWGEVEDIEPEEGMIQVFTQALCGVRFGWNRHAQGRCVGGTRRLRARRVFLPGTVFVLKKKPENLAELLVRGLGDGREQGYGAVLPHPGIAATPFERKPVEKPLKSADNAGKLAMEWFDLLVKREKVKLEYRGPSPSQISAVAERIKGKDEATKALDYLDNQREGRPSRIWERWSPVYGSVKDAISANSSEARKALRTLHDLAIMYRSSKQDEED